MTAGRTGCFLQQPIDWEAPVNIHHPMAWPASGVPFPEDHKNAHFTSGHVPASGT